MSVLGKSFNENASAMAFLDSTAPRESTPDSIIAASILRSSPEISLKMEFILLMTLDSSLACEGGFIKPVTFCAICSKLTSDV